MLHQRLLLASAFSVVACAQIAGFEQLSSPTIDDPQAGSHSAGAGRASQAGADADAGSEQVAGWSGEGASAGTSSGAGASGRGGSGGNISGGGSGPTAGVGGAAGGTVGATAGTGGAAAGASGAAGAPVSGGCNAQLLKNPNFDAGPSDWLLDSNGPGVSELSDVINKGTNQASILANVAPRPGGLYLAWLGGVVDSDKNTHVNLRQEVQIPAKISRLVLSGWIQIRTTESEPDETTDQLDLALQDDTMFWSFHVWKGTEVIGTWKSFSYPVADGAVLNAWRGRTLTFAAEAQADISEATSYWLDSLSLFAECP
jgi:hypothetical protein